MIVWLAAVAGAFLLGFLVRDLFAIGARTTTFGNRRAGDTAAAITLTSAEWDWPTSPPPAPIQLPESRRA